MGHSTIVGEALPRNNDLSIIMLQWKMLLREIDMSVWQFPEEVENMSVVRHSV